MCDGLSTLVSLLVYGHSLVGSHRHPHSTLNNNSQREYNKVGSVLYQYRRKVKNKKICIIVSKVVEEEHIFLKLLCNVNGNNSTPQQASKNQPTNPSSWSSSSSSSCLSWVHFLDHQSLYSSTIPVDKTRHKTRKWFRYILLCALQTNDGNNESFFVCFFFSYKSKRSFSMQQLFLQEYHIFSCGLSNQIPFRWVELDFFGMW